MTECVEQHLRDIAEGRTAISGGTLMYRLDAEVLPRERFREWVEVLKTSLPPGADVVVVMGDQMAVARVGGPTVTV